MPRHIMAVKHLLPLVLWTTASTFARATTFTLSSNISKFIPVCAAGCFESFLEANFSPGSCGTTPSLQCLCAQTGFSGFTIGEGAVSCIIVENDIGACSSEDASSKLGIPSPEASQHPSDTERRTASKITAAYGMCAGQVDAAPETHPTIRATLVVPSAGIGPVVVPTDAPNTFLTTASLPPVTRATATEAGSTAAAAALSTAKETPQQRLSAGQVAGISVGVSAAALLGVALILCCRRRRRKELGGGEEPGFAKIRDSWSLNRKSEISPRMLQISAPVHLQPPEMDFLRPFENQSTLRPDTIGLAISPAQQDAIRPDKQGSGPGGRSPQAAVDGLPRPALALAKPALAVAIPGADARPVPPPKATTKSVPLSGRESIVTEFAEDGETEANARNTQIWRRPLSLDPVSTTAYYVSDKSGNWILGNPPQGSDVAELEGSSPLTTKAEAGKRSIAEQFSFTFSAPSDERKPGDPIRSKPAQATSASRSRSSSVYSQYTLPLSIAPGLENPMPMPPANAYPKPTLENSAKRQPSIRKSRNLGRSDSAVSDHSVTTIASSLAEGEYEALDPLSPVVESPHSMSGGVSPVTYPNIHRRTPSDKFKLYPPPTRGDLHHPPGQPSPTLGHLPPTKAAATRTAKPNVRTNPNPDRNPGQVRTGSPNLPQGAQLPQSPYRLEELRVAPLRLASLSRPVVPPAVPPKDTRSNTPNSLSSTSGSLLTKRLGAERAAALTLGAHDPLSAKAGWTKHGGGLQDTTSPPLAPWFVADGAPASPAWQPRLTPSKRGDDLFLNVQRQ